ncbi:hypothetical protein ACKLNO_05075 [Neisseriaceae bacterium B1]
MAEPFVTHRLFCPKFDYDRNHLATKLLRGLSCLIITSTVFISIFIVYLNNSELSGMPDDVLALTQMMNVFANINLVFHLFF